MPTWRRWVRKPFLHHPSLPVASGSWRQSGQAAWARPHHRSCPVLQGPGCPHASLGREQMLGGQWHLASHLPPPLASRTTGHCGPLKGPSPAQQSPRGNSSMSQPSSLKTRLREGGGPLPCRGRFVARSGGQGHDGTKGPSDTLARPWESLGRSELFSLDLLLAKSLQDSRWQRGARSRAPTSPSGERS